MRIRPIMAAAAVAAALVLGPGLTAAHASTAADIPSGETWYPDSIAYPGSDWAWSTTHNIWYDNPSNQNQVLPTAGAWQELVDYNGPGYGQCITLNWPTNILDNKPCTGAASQEWASTCVRPYPGETCGDADAVWVFFNQYLQDSHPTYCAGDARQYIAVTSSSSNLIMLCPLDGGSKYGTAQEWTGEADS